MIEIKLEKRIGKVTRTCFKANFNSNNHVNNNCFRKVNINVLSRIIWRNSLFATVNKCNCRIVKS